MTMTLEKQLNKRTPSEKKSFYDGFNTAIKLAVDSISVRVATGHADSFADGMAYAAEVIKQNARAFKEVYEPMINSVGAEDDDCISRRDTLQAIIDKVGYKGQLLMVCQQEIYKLVSEMPAVGKRREQGVRRDFGRIN